MVVDRRRVVEEEAVELEMGDMVIHRPVEIWQAR
jgi:hypothetical protein